MRNSSSPGRMLKAYRVTYAILLKYLFLFLLKKIINTERARSLIERANEKTSAKIVKNILALKGLYIKIGQTLSIMTNFLPPSLTKGLEQLQDAVPPHPYDDVEARFLEDFQKKPLELFATFEKTPIAAASLGQVHVATLTDGTKLAVKLQYPEIDEVVKSDLKTIRKIFHTLDFFFPHYGLKGVYAECAKMILMELDYEVEGKNLEKIRENFKEKPEYVFPKIFWEYSSKKILTAEFMEGVKVTNVDKIREMGIKPHDVAVSLIHSYCKQIFIDGVYHADPHPGNIIVQSTAVLGPPKIAMIDFGATATISPQMKSGITRFVEGLIKKDTPMLSNAMKEMGFIAKGEKDEAFDRIVDYFYGKIRGVKIDDFRHINITNFQNLGDIFELKKMDISFRDLTSTFHVPKDWILLERAMLLMMGLVSHLDPHLNPVDIVIPYVEEFVLGREKNLADLLLESSKELLISYIKLPDEINKTLKKLQDGKIVLQVKHHRENAEKIYRGIHQLIYTMLLMFTGSLGYLFYDRGDELWQNRMMVASGAILFILVVSLLKNRK